MTRASEAEQSAWQARYDAGPAGIVVFNPKPKASMPRWLSIELAGNVMAALMAAIVILYVPGSVGLLRRALLVGLLGLLEGFDIDVSQWNWYSFPTTYMLAQLADHAVGWFLAGLVLARVCRDRA